MSLWRSILRWFGLYDEARVQITAPGIEVTLAGDPTQVRALMGVIRTELERRARRDRRLNQVRESQVVRPTELDEMDSPYALPEAVVLPVPDEEQRSEDRRSRLLAMSLQEPPTWPPAMSADDLHLATHPEAGFAEALFSPEEDSVRTALTPHPSEGPTPPSDKGVRAASPTSADTLQVDPRIDRVTRPLYPTVTPSDPPKSA